MVNGGNRIAGPLTSPAFDRIAGLAHGFLGRGEELPSQNTLSRTSVSPYLPGLSEAISLEQVHGAQVAIVGRTTAGVIAGVDGAVTRVPGKALVIRTADCIPMFFAAPAGKAIGAAHAGWRGLLDGIVLQTIECLEIEAGVAPYGMTCVLGPSIGSCCYEFSNDLFSRFINRYGEDCRSAWQDRGHKGHLDLRRLAALIVARAGLDPEKINLVGGCTYCQPKAFCSYRRDRSRAGRQLSFICLR